MMKRLANKQIRAEDWHAVRVVRVSARATKSGGLVHNITLEFPAGCVSVRVADSTAWQIATELKRRDYDVQHHGAWGPDVESQIQAMLATPEYEAEKRKAAVFGARCSFAATRGRLLRQIRKRLMQNEAVGAGFTEDECAVALTISEDEVRNMFKEAMIARIMGQ